MARAQTTVIISQRLQPAGPLGQLDIIGAGLVLGQLHGVGKFYVNHVALWASDEEISSRVAVDEFFIYFLTVLRMDHLNIYSQDPTK